MTFDVLARARRNGRRRIRITVTVGLAIIALAFLLHRVVNSGHGEAPEGAHPWPGESVTAAATSAVLPNDLSWVEVAGVVLPVSATAGPREPTRGFAHSPAGGVLAAVHLVARTTPQPGPAVFGPALAEQVVGPYAAAMRDHVMSAYRQMIAQAKVPYGQPVGRLTATLAGYRIDAYTPQAADLTILTQATDATGVARWAATKVRMVWTGTDWVLQAPAGGTWDAAVTIVGDAQAGTFTPFVGG